MRTFLSILVVMIMAGSMTIVQADGSTIGGTGTGGSGTGGGSGSGGGSGGTSQ